jgi:transcriptional regulator with XRE-family HTH domain
VNIEKGRQTPPIHVLWKMAKALNIPVGELFPDDVLSNGNSWDKIFSEQIPDYVSKENLLKFLGKTNS